MQFPVYSWQNLGKLPLKLKSQLSQEGKNDTVSTYEPRTQHNVSVLHLLVRRRDTVSFHSTILWTWTPSSGRDPVVSTDSRWISNGSLFKGAPSHNNMLLKILYFAEYIKKNSYIYIFFLHSTNNIYKNQ